MEDTWAPWSAIYVDYGGQEKELIKETEINKTRLDKKTRQDKRTINMARLDLEKSERVDKKGPYSSRLRRRKKTTLKKRPHTSRPFFVSGCAELPEPKEPESPDIIRKSSNKSNKLFAALKKETKGTKNPIPKDLRLDENEVPLLIEKFETLANSNRNRRDRTGRRKRHSRRSKRKKRRKRHSFYQKGNQLLIFGKESAFELVEDDFAKIINNRRCKQEEKDRLLFDIITICPDTYLHLMKITLDAGADPNGIVGFETMLGISCYWQKKKMTQCLLECGADVELQNLRGETPMQLAIEQKCKADNTLKRANDKVMDAVKLISLLCGSYGEQGEE